MRQTDAMADPTEVAVKGSVVRAIVTLLTEHGLQDEMIRQVSPRAAALIVEPPLPTMWVDARDSNDIYQALHDLVGPERLRRLNHDAIERGVSPLLKAAAEGVLRIFGASPGALLSKLDRVGGSTARGVVYHYVEIDAHSGHFDIEYPALRDVPVGPFVATGGALELVFDMCRVRGMFGEPVFVPNGRNNRMRFLVSWREITRR